MYLQGWFEYAENYHHCHFSPAPQYHNQCLWGWPSPAISHYLSCPLYPIFSRSQSTSTIIRRSRSRSECLNPLLSQHQPPGGCGRIPHSYHLCHKRRRWLDDPRGCVFSSIVRRLYVGVVLYRCPTHHRQDLACQERQLHSLRSVLKIQLSF